MTVGTKEQKLCTSFRRISKYLIPCDATAFNLLGSQPPTQLAFARDLAKRFPDQVKRIALACEPAARELRVQTMCEGQLVTKEFSSSPELERAIFQYTNASCVGRHLSIIGPERTLVAEYGSDVPAVHSPRSFRWNYLNPVFWRHQWQYDLRTRPQLPQMKQVRGSAALLNNQSCHNFYHWLLEIVSRIMMLREACIEPDWYVLDCQSSYQRRILELIGINPDRCIQPHYGLHLKADLLLRPTPPGTCDWQALSQCVLQRLDQTECIATHDITQQNKQILFISRKDAANRKLCNETELLTALNEYACSEGYRVASQSFEKLDYAQQVQMIRNSHIIISTHGSALANLIYAKPHTTVIEICPATRHNLQCFPRISQRMGLKHVVVVAKNRSWTKLLVNPRDVLQAVTKVLSLR